MAAETATGGAAVAPNGTPDNPEGGNCYQDDCLFCRIISGEEKTELLYTGEEFVCFKDVKSGVPHHYLVVPRVHMENCKTLKQEHIPIVRRMMEVGRLVLQQNMVTDLDDISLGFHWPPFCSVPHLHLHALAPASQLGPQSRYRTNSFWFITADQLIERLKKPSAKKNNAT
ncbi:histidine triad nucleotide-binding protein 3-like [Protopterus annectens]|uniref:histidine triad nucleotide-binding protein 3-like n=1 Tax=Protopterus annectens TaxID=7888 RepID=UPI001CFA53A5|nr:histidine triad nucleotide-binding protein 3-like [Protopterus annectens]